MQIGGRSIINLRYASEHLTGYKQRWFEMTFDELKGESAKAGLYLNFKTKIMITEEIHNFNIDCADIEIVEDFTYFGLVINSSGDSTQEIKRRPRLRRAAVKELGKITHVSLETKVKIIHTLIF